MSALTTTWIYDDGGRAAAGFRGDAGDCGARAIAIATGKPYREVYDALAAIQSARGRAKSARNGVLRFSMDALLVVKYGWEWEPTMAVGDGCSVHLRADELPAGPLVVRLSKHFAAVIDGLLHDTHDSSRGGTRCVYGYWCPPNA